MRWRYWIEIEFHTCLRRDMVNNPRFENLTYECIFHPALRSKDVTLTNGALLDHTKQAMKIRGRQTQESGIDHSHGTSQGFLLLLRFNGMLMQRQR